MNVIRMVIVFFIITQGVVFSETPQFSIIESSVNISNEESRSILRKSVVRLASEKVLSTYFNASFTVPLFENVELEINNCVVTQNSKGWYVTGQVGDDEGSRLFFNYNGKYLVGKIEIDGLVYQLNPLSENSWEVLEIDPGRLIIDEDTDPDSLGMIEDVEHEIPIVAEALETDDIDAPEGKTVIDILVLYTPEYASSYGNNTSLIEAEVDTRIVEANQIYSNSNIDIKIVVLYHGIINVSNDVSSARDLKNDYPIVTSLREQYGADLVSVWKTGGSAGSSNNYSGSSTAVFGLARKDVIQSSYTFVHELGHSMGGKHDRQTYVNQGRGSELTQEKYRYGLSFSNYRTVMSYDNCSSSSCGRIPYFTNPDVLYNGTPTGIALGQANPANNAQRLNDTKNTIAGFRTSTVILSSSEELSSSIQASSSYSSGAPSSSIGESSNESSSISSSEVISESSQQMSSSVKDGRSSSVEYSSSQITSSESSTFEESSSTMESSDALTESSALSSFELGESSFDTDENESSNVDDSSTEDVSPVYTFENQKKVNVRIENGSFTVVGEGPHKVSLFSVYGQRISTWYLPESESTIHYSEYSLQTGVYVIQLESSGGQRIPLVIGR